MAFIYRADRDPNIFHISSSQVGPGEYLDKKPKISPRQNKEPFLTSAEKFTNQININETPGPGSYYQDTQKLNNIKKIEKSNYNYNNDLVFARIKKNIVTLNPTEKLGFDSKAKRFISDGLIKTNSEFYKTPGPGQYFPSIINDAQNANNKNKRFNQNKTKLAFIKSNSTSNMNISQEKIGLATVIIESNNNNNKKENNKLRKTFQYDNYACRPKLYNIQKFREIMQYNNKNNKTFNENTNSLYSTNYSDNKKRTRNKQNFRIFDINEEYSIIKNSEDKLNTGNTELRKEILDFFKTYNSNNKNAMKSRINFCKKRNMKKIDNKKIDDIDKLLEAKPPGPGYYFDILCKPIKYSKIQNYFTKEKKFHQLKKPWTQLGPGQYFIAPNIRNKSNSINKDIPFGSNEKRNNTFLCLENTRNNPGPGNYEFQPFTKDIEKEKEEHPLLDVQFGFTGERFNDNYTMRDKYNTPGPGYYISNNDNKQNNNKDLKLLIHPAKTSEKFNIKKITNTNKNKFLNGKYTSLEEYKFRDNVPPVGYYYPEYFSTIEYKNRINLMNSKNADICFNKSITKSLKKSDSAPNIVGPGYYITNKEKKKNISINENHPPFFSSQDKKSFPEKKKKIKINFGELNKYQMKDYFQWNKKSFNVIFV